MPYQVILSGLSSVRGTHHTANSEFVYFVRSSNDPEAGIYRMPTGPAVQIVEGQAQVMGILPINLNALLNPDLRWSAGALRALFGAKIAALAGTSSLDDVSPEQLLAIDWDAIPVNNFLPEPGTSPEGAFYAARVPSINGELNYVKLRIYNDGMRRIDWITYMMGTEPRQVSGITGDWYDLIVTEFESSIFLSGSDESGVGMVVRLDRTTEGPYPQYNEALAYPINTGTLVEPRQLAIDGPFVYVVDSTSLWRIDSTTGDQVELVQGLGGGVGLLLDVTAAGIVAYISNAAGAIYVVNLSDHVLGTPLSPSYSIGGQSGFMSWASEERNAILVAEQTTGRVLRLELTGGTITEDVAGLSMPWGAEALSPIDTYVASEGEIGINRFVIETNPGIIVLGVGLIPWGYINDSDDSERVSEVIQGLPLDTNVGRANTSSAQGYYFWQYPNIPFGGNLSLQLNHEEAHQQGFREYRVSVYNSTLGWVDHTKADFTFTNLRWTGSVFAPETRSSVGGWFSFNEPEALWYNPFLAAIVRTNTSYNGHNIVRIEMRGPGLPTVMEERVILIDNTRYNTGLEFPRLGTSDVAPAPGVYPTLDCGCIGYQTKNDLLEIDFRAWHPRGAGTYLMRFFRGTTQLTSLTEVADVAQWEDPLVPPSWSTRSTAVSTPLRVGHLLESCNIANVRVMVTVSSRVTDGFGWVNLSSHSERSFTLAPATAMGNTAWVDPG